jgi:LEA14-like dessication related protein
MKKIQTLILLALGGGAAYYFLRGKKESLENLIIKPLDIAINTKKSRQSFFAFLFFTIKIKITNPSGYSVNIQSIDLDLLINRKKIANIEKNTTIFIKAKESKIIEIETSISAAGIITQIMEMIGGEKNINAALIGNVKTDLGTINIDYSKDLL